MTREKLFQPDSNGPDDKIIVERHPPLTTVYHIDASGETVGLVELRKGWKDIRGTFSERGPLLEWGWTHYHANGDRTVHYNRLTAAVIDDTLRIRRFKRKKDKYGDRPGHDWREIDRWEVSE